MSTDSEITSKSHYEFHSKFHNWLGPQEPVNDDYEDEKDPWVRESDDEDVSHYIWPEGDNVGTADPIEPIKKAEAAVQMESPPKGELPEHIDKFAHSQTAIRIHKQIYKDVHPNYTKFNTVIESTGHPVGGWRKTRNHLNETSPLINTIGDEILQGKAHLNHLFRAYKHAPHTPASVLMKYMIHRVNNLDGYDNSEKAKGLDEDFLKLHKQGDAHEDNGHLESHDLHAWTLNNPHLIDELINHRDNLHKNILKGIGLNVKDIKGEPHIALTRDLNTPVMRKNHVGSSWADVPDPGFGNYHHHAWVPLKDIWYSYDMGPESASSGQFGHENEFIVSNSGSKFKATKDDVYTSKYKGFRLGDNEDPLLAGHFLFDKVNDDEISGALERARNFSPKTLMKTIDRLDLNKIGPKTHQFLKDLSKQDYNQSWRLTAKFALSKLTPRDEALQKLKDGHISINEAIRNKNLNSDDISNLLDESRSIDINTDSSDDLDEEHLFNHPSFDFDKHMPKVLPKIKRGARDRLLSKKNTPLKHIKDIVNQVSDSDMSPYGKAELHANVLQRKDLDHEISDRLYEVANNHSSMNILEKGNFSLETQKKIAFSSDPDRFNFLDFNRNVHPDVIRDVYNSAKSGDFTPNPKGGSGVAIPRVITNNKNTPQDIIDTVIDEDFGKLSDSSKLTIINRKDLSEKSIKNLINKGPSVAERLMKEHWQTLPLNLFKELLHHSGYSNTDSIVGEWYDRRLNHEAQMKHHIIQPFPENTNGK